MADEFQAAAKRILDLKREPTNDEKSKLYGLFKQATVGDVNVAQPYFFDLVGKAKWDAWNKYKGTSQDDAKKKYIKYVDKLLTSQ
jgi:acyl-CoA-binding protein